MIQSILAALISFFIVEPLQAEMKETLAAARAPEAVIAPVLSCAREAAPQIVERAAADPWWAAVSTFGIWLGTASPDAILVEAAPGCRRAVEAARPFLAGRSA